MLKFVIILNQEEKMKNKNKDKKAQVTIFIIVAIVIVVGIMVFLFLRSDISIINSGGVNPKQEIDVCVREKALEGISIMFRQGGYISPVLYKWYENKSVAYLCYQKNYYLQCINQEPMYINHLEEEIENYIFDYVDECFSDLARDYESRGYGVTLGEMYMDIGLKMKRVDININRVFEIEKGQSQKFESFDISFPSSLYELASVAMEIASSEAEYCSFEYVGYMIGNPDIKIEKKQVGSGKDVSKIYIIEDRKTKQKLNIAIRGCAIPAGM